MTTVAEYVDQLAYNRALVLAQIDTQIAVLEDLRSKMEALADLDVYVAKGVPDAQSARAAMNTSFANAVVGCTDPIAGSVVAVGAIFDHYTASNALQALL